MTDMRIKGPLEQIFDQLQEVNLTVNELKEEVAEINKTVDSHTIQLGTMNRRIEHLEHKTRLRLVDNE